MKRFLLLLLLFPAPALAQDTTVRVLTLAHLHQIQLTPNNPAASTRTCPTCSPHPANPITITAAGARLVIGKTHPVELFADGSFELQAAQQRPQLLIGKLHITAAHNELLLRLTLPMERYVANVLNGETAPDEPLESLKAMAIVARTYATGNHAHKAEGFDLCDDTHCQVARWATPRPLVAQAVRETAGETLWYQRARAHVFFHQQCGGMTADARDVWPSEATSNLPYLRPHRDIYCVKRNNSEWSSEVRPADLHAALAASGIQADGPPTITDRTAYGRARTITIGNTEIPANTFRIAVDRSLGWNIIKSDWYEIETRGDTIAFHGRGSGHGVGLCQIGAAEMASEGLDATAILNEYFPGTTVGITANDRGWITRQTGRLTIIATTESDFQRVIPIANAAWQRAQSQFPAAGPPHIIIRIYPSVELFRQATNEPGYTAASTQANEISLEPLSILTQKSLLTPVLEHEFLHTLIESESTPATPLWLREGLAEALSQRPLHATSAAWPVAKIDQQLAHPASQAAANEAHTQAGLRVREYIRRYGLPTVRQWLRSGVPNSVLVVSFSLPAPTPHPHASHPNRR